MAGGTDEPDFGDNVLVSGKVLRVLHYIFADAEGDHCNPKFLLGEASGLLMLAMERAKEIDPKSRRNQQLQGE